MTTLELQQSLFTFKLEGRNTEVFLKKQPEGWNVFTLVNPENKLTAELWVETECDYFEWQDWDKGFFTQVEEQTTQFDGTYLTDVYGQELMEYVQGEFEDLFPMFH